MSDELAHAFDHVAGMLTRTLGTPTDTRPVDRFTRQRRAWTTHTPRLTHTTHVVVVLDGRGVVVWASGPGGALHARLSTPHMVIAPSPDLTARIERGEARSVFTASVTEVLLHTREPWRGLSVRTTVAVAVELVRALMAGELARGEDQHAKATGESMKDDFLSPPEETRSHEEKTGAYIVLARGEVLAQYNGEGRVVTKAHLCVEMTHEEGVGLRDAVTAYAQRLGWDVFCVLAPDCPLPKSTRDS